MFLCLGVETSCDETSAAVVRDGRDVLSTVVRSQIDLHRVFGGVVPELACRAHVETIVPVIEQALNEAGTAAAQVDAVAVTHTPGLVGALLVGVSAAKAFALAHGKPLVGVHHLEAHLYACRMGCPELEFPCVSLVVSGGHTSLYESRGPTDPRRLGGTLDDAAGEAFDKAAAILGLPFPGGPSIERAARGGNPRGFAFPRTMLGRESLDFSFSGIKTAVLYEVVGQEAFRENPSTRAERSAIDDPPSLRVPLARGHTPRSGEGRPGRTRSRLPSRRDILNEVGARELIPPQRLADLCASFQEAVVDVLVAKAVRAAERLDLERIAVGGGVACNGRLREKFEAAAAKRGMRAFFPPPHLCTDNAAMIAGLGYHLSQAGRYADLALDVAPT